MPSRVRKKVLINPGQKLLEKITPRQEGFYFFVPWICTYEVDDKGTRVKKIENVLRRNRIIDSEISPICERLTELAKKPKFSFLKEHDRIESLAYELWCFFFWPSFWIDLPTIKTFEDDVKVFLKIAIKHPKHISEAAQRISNKYSQLGRLSIEYQNWGQWLPYSWDNQITRYDWSHFFEDGESKNKEAIQFAYDVLVSIPPDKALRNGTKYDLGTRWLVSVFYNFWPYKNEKNKCPIFYFYAFFEVVFTEALSTLDSPHQELIREHFDIFLIEKEVPESDELVKSPRVITNKNFRKKAKEQILGRTPKHRIWKGGRYGKRYYPPYSNLDFLEKIQSFFQREKYYLSRSIGLYFTQPGFFKSRWSRFLRNRKYYKKMHQNI